MRGVIMVFYTARELRNNTKAIWDSLDEQNDVVITSNGKPRALMIDIENDDLTEVINMLVSARGMRAFSNMRRQAIANGTADMPMEEIDAEIAAYRAEKRAAKSSTA